MNWKIWFWILLSILIIENLFLFWGYSMVRNDEENTKLCYYKVCANYPEAFYEDGICQCYNYDLIGNPIVNKTELLN